MNILLTGHAGFVCSHVADLAWSRGHKLYGMDDFSTGKMKNVHPRVIFGKKKMSITNPRNINKMMEMAKPDVIIHLAAQPSLIESIRRPDNDARINVLGTVLMLRAAQKHGVRNFVFASTCASYGHENNRITSPYAASKRSAEFYVSLLAPKAFSVLRFSNVYGPRQVPLGENQLVPRALRQIYFGEDFTIYGDGKQTRDFIYVEDVAEAVLQAAENFKFRGMLQISYGFSYSVNQILRLLKNITGYDPPFSHGEIKPHEPRKVEISNIHAKHELDWYPHYGLDAGLRKTVEWWNEQK